MEVGVLVEACEVLCSFPTWSCSLWPSHGCCSSCTKPHCSELEHDLDPSSASGSDSDSDWLFEGWEFGGSSFASGANSGNSVKSQCRSLKNLSKCNW